MARRPPGRERGEQQLGIGRNVAPSRLRNRLELGDRGVGRAEVATPRTEDGPVGQVDRQPRQRARVAALPEIARALTVRQLSSSQMSLAEIVVSQPQRKFS